MSDRERVLRSLVDFLRFSDTAAKVIVARGKAAYDSDEALRLAAEAILHKIGEAVARLPEDFTAANPEVSWRSMKATRNLVAHSYDQVDYDLLWGALARQLPIEAERVRSILSRLNT
ncbi:DUF86 domain-containing protein [Sinomonas flava]|uniref:HepT-like ribonuclease domain-containing protein n=1 Tax=Sinomonas flava TaxID=496857 RepID=UPI0039A5EC7E